MYSMYQVLEVGCVTDVRVACTERSSTCMVTATLRGFTAHQLLTPHHL